MTGRLLGSSRPVLLRADSAFYGADVVHAARAGGAGPAANVQDRDGARWYRAGPS